MSKELEQFGARLAAAVNARRVASHDGYLHFSHLEEAIREATNPPDASSAEYPLMMYHDGHHRIVNNAAQEATAKAEGFTRQAPPQYEARFPKSMIEKPTSMGGWKQWDLRRVQLNTSAEERQFLAVVESQDWIPDDQRFGGRGIALAELVAERKELMKGIIDAEQLEPAEAPDAQNDEVSNG
jgi:hypothetical protein